jgi:hypothetical protein
MYLINGFPLPPGVVDPYTMAQRVDDRMGDAKAEPYNLIAITAMIGLSCDPELCTLEFKEQVDGMHQLILSQRMWASNPVHMTAFCFNGGVMGGFAYGLSVCVGFDDKGWGGYVTTVGGVGANISPIGVSGTMQTSNGLLVDQKGGFDYLQVTPGPGDFSTAWGTGTMKQPVRTDAWGVGSPGLGASRGKSQTYVWVCCEWKIYK